MKTLIVYYSRTGTTKKVAEALKARFANLTICDIEEIISIKNRQGLIGYLLSGYEAMREVPAQIKPLTKNPADYDLIIIGTPVWGYNISSPIRAFLNKNKDQLKKVAFFATCGGSGQERTFQRMADVSGLQPIAMLYFKTADVVQGKMEEKINEFTSKLQ
ncbi:MAG: NAD(P)H-dependent oxidoreductase [Candidatus Falkowbacteria bacterium]|nr:NAD(P)H-dependent oxidoreductase [Candidatus Falkowbacteria bacterium]